MDELFLTDRQIAARYQIRRASVWEWCRAGRFPKPVKLSPGCTRWRLSDVEAHEAALISREKA